MRILPSLILVTALTALAAGFFQFQIDQGGEAVSEPETYYLNLAPGNSEKILTATPPSSTDKMKAAAISLPANQEFVTLGKWITPSPVENGDKKLKSLELYLGAFPASSAGKPDSSVGRSDSGGKATLQIRAFKINTLGFQTPIGEALKTITLKAGPPTGRAGLPGNFQIDVPFSISHHFNNERLGLEISMSVNKKATLNALLYYGNLTVPAKVILK